MLISGIASTTKLDLRDSIIADGACSWSLENLGVAGIKLLLDHNHDRGPAGLISHLVYHNGKLWVSAILEDAERIAAIRAGKQYGFSLGGIMLAAKRQPGGELLVTNLFLQEISVTDRPANTDCLLVETYRGWSDDFKDEMIERARLVAATPQRQFTPMIRYPETCEQTHDT